MSFRLHRVALVALLTIGSAILLFSCKSKQTMAEESLDAIKTEESENLTIVMSENGRRSYLFKTPLLEGYTLGRDPYREFRKGISITTYQDDSLTTVNAVLVANYAIYYENRKLWEAKGDVVITKHDGTRLYTQQLFWNSITKRIYSNVDTRLVTETDEVIGEGFESDEEMNEPRFRRWKGKMQVDTEQLRNESKSDGAKGDEPKGNESANSEKSKLDKPTAKQSAKPATAPNKGRITPPSTPPSKQRPNANPQFRQQQRPNAGQRRTPPRMNAPKSATSSQIVERDTEQGEEQKPMSPKPRSQKRLPNLKNIQ